MSNGCEEGQIRAVTVKDAEKLRAVTAGTAVPSLSEQPSLHPVAMPSTTLTWKPGIATVKPTIPTPGTPPTMVIPAVPSLHLTGITANAALQSAVEQPDVVTHPVEQPTAPVLTVLPSILQPVHEIPIPLAQPGQIVTIQPPVQRAAPFGGLTAGTTGIQYVGMAPFLGVLPNGGMSGLMPGGVQFQEKGGEAEDEPTPYEKVPWEKGPKIPPPYAPAGKGADSTYKKKLENVTFDKRVLWGYTFYFILLRRVPGYDEMDIIQIKKRTARMKLPGGQWEALDEKTDKDWVVDGKTSDTDPTYNGVHIVNSEKKDDPNGDSVLYSDTPSLDKPAGLAAGTIVEITWNFQTFFVSTKPRAILGRYEWTFVLTYTATDTGGSGSISSDKFSDFKAGAGNELKDALAREGFKDWANLIK